MDLGDSRKHFAIVLEASMPTGEETEQPASAGSRGSEAASGTERPDVLIIYGTGTRRDEPAVVLHPGSRDHRAVPGLYKTTYFYKGNVRWVRSSALELIVRDQGYGRPGIPARWTPGLYAEINELLQDTEWAFRRS